jgi:outer membrane autotransporter protein
LNTWVDSKTSWIDAGNEFSPTDGTSFNATGGADYRIGDRMILGVFGSLEGSDLETGGFIPSTTKTDGIGAGIYTGITLTPNIVFSGIVSGAAVDTDLDYGFVAAALDSTRVQASGSLTGYWYIDSWRVSPSATLAWSKEWQNPFVDSLGFPGPKQAFESAVLTVGNQVGRTFALESGSLEPFAGYQFDWTFLSSVETDGFEKTKYQDTYDLRVQAGVNWTIANGGSLSLTGELGGLLMPDNTVYSGEVNYSIQF